MPHVTALERTRRRRGWTDVHIDGVFSCSLPDEAVTALGLSSGEEIDAPRLAALQTKADREEAVRLALHYLSYRSRSRREVERYLRRNGCAPAGISDAMERCERLGYLDDVEFAAAYARDRFRLKPRSIRQIVSELAAKGVCRPDAEAGAQRALNDEGIVEKDLIERAIARAARRFRSLEPEARRRRLWAYLQRRGFDGDAIRLVVERETHPESPERPTP